MVQIQKGKPYWLCTRCQCDIPFAIAAPQSHKTEQTSLYYENLEAALREQDPMHAQDLHLELHRLNHLKEDFLSTTSHELMTPLSNIKMSIQLMEMLMHQLPHASSQKTDHPHRSVEATHDKLKHYLGVLDQECDREIRLISDMLMLLQLEAGTQPILPTAIALPDWLEETIENFEAKAQQRQQTIQFTLTTPLPLVSTDTVLLKRVVNELIGNACKFAPEESTIALVAFAKVGAVQLRIGNLAPPVSDRDRVAMFNKFYRIPTSDPWKHEGLGLGLTLVKRAVELLGGSVWAEYSGKHLWMVVELPCQESHGQSSHDLLMSYVAFYLSRGKTVNSPVHGSLPFEGIVYDYWGYTREFLEYWQRLEHRRDFRELYVDSDIYSFGKFLCGTCTVHECARCHLPISQTTVGNALPNCLCSETEITPTPSQPIPQTPEANDDSAESPALMRVLIVGTLPDSIEAMQAWYATNGIDAVFAASPEAIAPHDLAQPVGLVFIDANLSEMTVQTWASQLSTHPQIQQIPIVALSPKHSAGKVWSDRTMNAADYLISPLGDNLIHQIQTRSQEKYAQPAGATTANVHWFPR
ncbi:ATP-binding protein [Leptolyngbya sp. AN02str]|uniref:sensor histidine kinase n=1 Tax=Leptolyngbya sp. AN02str TaxID=3423363 RepID=UPI003D30F286